MKKDHRGGARPDDMRGTRWWRGTAGHLGCRIADQTLSGVACVCGSTIRLVPERAWAQAIGPTGELRERRAADGCDNNRCRHARCWIE